MAAKYPHQLWLKVTYGTQAARDADAKAKKASSGSVKTYKVKNGDTLWKISKKFYKDGKYYTEIYAANKQLIEDVAKAWGKPNSAKGYYLFAKTPGGEVVKLTIPSAAAAKAVKKASKKKKRNAKIAKKIQNMAEALTYTDVASGQSDSLSITLANINKEWMGKYMPKKGTLMGVKFVLRNWKLKLKKTKKKFNCGKFVLDDISFSGRPMECVLGGVSVPINNDFKSLPRTRTWAASTVKDIAAEIAGRAGVKIYYNADSIAVDELEQNNQTDSAFLSSLCDKYGLALKVYNYKIIIYDINKYEAKKCVKTFREKDIINWSYNTTIEGAYTGCVLTYTNPDADDPIEVGIGSPGRLYYMNVQANTYADAEMQAIAKVNNENRKAATATLTIRGPQKSYSASQNIRIKGLGKINGKYFIDKIAHSVGDSGYTMQLTLHRVQKKITNSNHEIVGEVKNVIANPIK